jgi:2-haloacid dehalogenase
MSENRTPGVRGVVFDVNGTLSDLAPLDDLFRSVGAPRGLAATWFACVLRDGFALAAVGEARPFSDVATDQLRVLLHGAELTVPAGAAVSTIMDGFTSVDVHDDVAPSLRALAASDITVMTLSNGAAGVARALLERAGVADTIDGFLTVEGASRWKPAPDSYAVATRHSGLAPAELMLVAVHPWDIHGAVAAGFRTAWLNRDGGVYPGYFAKPDHVLTDLRRLVDVITGVA